MDRRIVAIGVALLLVLSLGGLSAPVSADTSPNFRSGTDAGHSTVSVSPISGERAATAEENQLVRTMTFALRPADPGTVTVDMAFEIPDQVVRLKTAIPANATVVETDGFQSAGDGNYSWDESTATPSVTLALAVNRTGSYHVRPDSSDGVTETEPGLMFADTGKWAIASVPPASVWWSSYANSPRVRFVGLTAVDGAGVAGDRMVYLGPHTSQTRAIDGQQVTLVVPEAASLDPAASAVLDSIEAAAPHLPSPTAERSLFIAAPTSVDWGPYGLADRTDTWVRADQQIDTPANVWLHEFVHLRQDFRTESDARWITEGMAEYYAAYLTLEQGRIDFGAFSDHLDRGTRSRYDDTVLSRPGTWNPLGNYAKGALVYGTIDYRIRSDTDGAYAARHVFEALNERDRPVNHAVLRSELGRFVDAGTLSEVTDFVTTTRTPDPWSRVDHEEAFGTAPADVVTGVDDPFELTGPYRNRSVDRIPTLVPGERLSIPVTVTNEGGETGTYDLTLTVDGTPVENASGTLTGGASTTVVLSYTVSAVGSARLELDGHTWTIAVEEPATPEIAALAVSDEQPDLDSEISVRVTITNPADRPASGLVSPTSDGEKLASWDIDLDAGESVERTLQVTVTEPGVHEIAVGSRTKRVTVIDPSTTGTTTEQFTTEPSTADGDPTTQPTEPGTTATTTPGFTVLHPVVSLVFAGLFFRRTR